MGSEGGDMVQTFDFGSIEEMDPSVGKLFRSRYIGALCALFVRQQRGDRPTLLLEKDSYTYSHRMLKCGTPSA